MQDLDLERLLDILGVDSETNSSSSSRIDGDIVGAAIDETETLNSQRNVYSERNMMILMNMTLQCLAGVKRIVSRRYKNIHACTILNHTNDTNAFHKQQQTLDAISRTFTIAVKRILSRLFTLHENHDLDPAKHLIESFPNQTLFGADNWLAMHWAVLGDIDLNTLMTKKNRKCLDLLDGCNTQLQLTNAPMHSHSDDKPISHQPKDFSGNKHAIMEEEDQCSLVKKLALAYPESVTDVDKEGRSFLHYACRINSVEIISTALSVAIPRISCTYTNQNGALPFHNAARFSSSLEVIRYVKRQYPEALIRGNNDGTLPIHWAAAKTKNVEIIDELLAEYPEGIRIPNSEQ